MKNQPTNQPTNAPSLLEAYSELSRGECHVLKKMAEGQPNRQIATELHVSRKTVENHITNIGKKLQIKGRGRLRNWLKEMHS
jgi:DNA-binding NarL/FixJ family response regulator